MFEGIRLTLVCAMCAASGKNSDGEPIVCYSSARTLFPSIPPKRVKDLGSTPRRNPHYRNASPMRMYSVAELKVLHNRIEQETQVRKADVEEKRNIRLARMVSVHHISPAAPLHRALFPHIFEDYLCASFPKQTLKRLKYRFGMHDTAVRLCALDPVAAMHWLERKRVTTSRFSQDLLHEFEYSLFVTSRAFRLEGLAISRYICPAQLAGMKTGPLSAIPESVERFRKNAPYMLRMSLRNLGFDGAEMDRMMQSPAMKTRIGRCIKYAHDPETVAKKMAEFWRTKSNREHRRRILEKAMCDKGLNIRADSVYCHDFICGLIDVDLEEIVGIQYITRELFDFGGSYFWKDCHHACEDAYRRALVENGNAMDQAIEIALRVSAKRRKRWI